MPSKLHRSRFVNVRPAANTRGDSDDDAQTVAHPHLDSDMLLHRHVQFDMSKNICWTLPSKKACKRAAARAEGFQSQSSETEDDELSTAASDDRCATAGRGGMVTAAPPTVTITALPSAATRQQPSPTPTVSAPHHSILKTKRNPNSDAELRLARQNRTLNVRATEAEASRRDLAEMLAASSLSPSSSGATSLTKHYDTFEAEPARPLSPAMIKALSLPVTAGKHRPASTSDINNSSNYVINDSNKNISNKNKKPGMKKKKFVPAGLVDQIVRDVAV